MIYVSYRSMVYVSLFVLTVKVTLYFGMVIFKNEHTFPKINFLSIRYLNNFLATYHLRSAFAQTCQKRLHACPKFTREIVLRLRTVSVQKIFYVALTDKFCFHITFFYMILSFIQCIVKNKTSIKCK